MDETEPTPSSEETALDEDPLIAYLHAEKLAGRSMTTEELWAQDLPEGDDLDEFTDRMMSERLGESAEE